MPSSKKFNSPEMDSAIQVFKDWRSSRGKIRRIPDHLWQIASNLFVQYRYPISTICRKLGLNWGDLKEKITRLSSNHPAPLNFVQVRRTRLEKLFNSLICHHHYPGYTHPVGEHLKYLVFSNSGQRPVACFAWSPAVRHLGSRKRKRGQANFNIRILNFQEGCAVFLQHFPIPGRPEVSI